MKRLGLMLVGSVVLGSAACWMENPEFDELETAAHSSADAADGSEGADSKGETAAGDGDPSGDGDPGMSESGPGDTGGDGDGDGDPNMTGDGDGDPNLMCDSIEPVDECQSCAVDKCCQAGINMCFAAEQGCYCLLECMADGKSPLECGGICPGDFVAIDVVSQYLLCLASECGDLCL